MPRTPHRTRRRLAVATAAVALTGVLGACGGDDDPDNIDVETGDTTEVEPGDVTTPDAIEPDPGEVTGDPVNPSPS